jgi:hypothetical protein
MDEQLHRERTNPDRAKRFFTARLNELPSGVFVTRPEWAEQAYLLWEAHLYAWSPAGYDEGRSFSGRKEVVVLTPQSTMKTLQSGYVPKIHPSRRVR